MNDTNQKNPFALIEEQMAKNKNKPDGICDKCKHILGRRCFDGVGSEFTIFSCKYSDAVDVDKFSVMACTQFEPEE